MTGQDFAEGLAVGCIFIAALVLVLMAWTRDVGRRQ